MLLLDYCDVESSVVFGEYWICLLCYNRRLLLSYHGYTSTKDEMVPVL